MSRYYPLDLQARFEHKYFGNVPNDNFKKWRRKLLKNCSVIESNDPEKVCQVNLQGVLSLIYGNMNKYTIFFYSRKSLTIVQLLHKIIPLEYFGSNLNRKRFFFVVKRIMTQTRGEYIHMSVLFEKFDDADLAWLNRRQDVKIQILQANILLLQTVVKPLIQYYYDFLFSFRTREYKVIPRGRMHSFIDRNMARTIKRGYLTKLKDLTPLRPPVAGKLMFIPKTTVSQLQHRPIVQCYVKNKTLLNIIKVKLKRLIKLYQLSGPTSLYKKWVEFVKVNNNNVKSRKIRKLYAVKLDLFDAFSMVDMKLLQSIIQNDDKVFSDADKKFCFKLLSKQYVTVRGNSIYKWHNGLLQGTMLSPLFCELYLSYLTNKHLKSFNKPNCFLHRTVDDMLFVSTSAYEVMDFELAAFCMAILNEDKTQKFLNEEGDDPHMVFCGKVFNFNTRELSASYPFQRGTNLRGKFKFWNKKKQFGKDEAYKFIVSCLGYSSINFYFSNCELNTFCNTPKTVLKNIFDGMCFVGFKLFYAVDSIEYLFESTSIRCATVLRAVDFIIDTYTPIILKTIKQHGGKRDGSIFSFNVIKFLCLKAFVVVLQRRHFKYKEAIAGMKLMVREMWIPRFKEYVDFKYISKLPKPFENITMGRTPAV